MAKTVEFSNVHPSDEVIAWFSKHVGPRTHYLKDNIGGAGWRFKSEQDNPYSPRRTWYLTVDDEKWLTYWTLMK